MVVRKREYDRRSRPLHPRSRVGSDVAAAVEVRHLAMLLCGDPGVE
jgi:hypothetical protein